MSPLVVIGALFLLSLIAAVVLFKWLESSALVKMPAGQFGGAIAAFIGVFFMLHHAYERLDARKVAVPELRLPDSYVPYISETYGFGFGYPKKDAFRTEGPRTEVLGIIEMPGSKASVSVSIIRFDSADEFERFRTNMDKGWGPGLPGVVNVTATDYSAGGLRGKLMETEPVQASAGGPTKTFILPNPARKVAYLFNLGTCPGCQFTDDAMASFKDILSTVQVSQK
jgi:hypothetical protein